MKIKIPLVQSTIMKMLAVGGSGLFAFSSVQAATITWTAQGTFTDNSFLSVAGTPANQVYGVDFGGSGTQTTANGYSFTDFATSGNFSVAGTGTGLYGGYLTGGATTGDTALDSVLTHGLYGGPGNTGILNNLTIGLTYTVLVLLDDTRGAAAGGTVFHANDGTSNSPDQAYSFANGSPSVGGYILGTFTADATTQALSVLNVSQVVNSQYNGILLGLAPVPEPTTVALLGGGILLIGALRRKK